jgi:hypothetical protein
MPYLIASVMMRFTANLYYDILGYDAKQFDRYILNFPLETFPQNYGQNKGEKCISARSCWTKAMNSKIYGEQLNKGKLNVVLNMIKKMAYVLH